MNFFKIFLSIILLIIIFDKLFFFCILFIYYLIQKYIYKNKIENPYYTITNFLNFEINKESYKNLYYSNVPTNSFQELGAIFKNKELNFNEYPNVEIKAGQKLFQDNKFLPECCFYNNQYSSDKGCPCITPEQQYYLQYRGLNRHPNSFIQEKNDYKNLFFSPTMALKGEKIPFNKNNIYFQRDEPPLSDTSINQVFSLLNERAR